MKNFFLITIALALFEGHSVAFNITDDKKQNLTDRAYSSPLEQNGYVASISNHFNHSSSNHLRSVQTLSEKDFTHRGKTSKSITIRKPGIYRLSETIHWNPNSPSTAIIIDADNVYLDLCKHQLVQVNQVHPCIGIKVKTGHQNVTIVNGSIQNFTQLGLYVQGGQKDIFIGNKKGRLLVNGCGYGASQAFFDPAANQPVIQGGIVLGETRTFASLGYYSYHGLIETAILTNVLAEENGPAGIFFGAGTTFKVKNCFFCGNAETRIAGKPNPLGFGDTAVGQNTTVAIGALAGITSDGFGDENCVSYEFAQCHFDNNSARGDTPVCFGFDSGYNIDGLVIRNSTFNSNRGEGATSSDGFGTYGCIMGGNLGVLVEDCESNDNFSEYFAEGFHHSGRNTSFDPEQGTPGIGLVYRRCNANRNLATGALGFVGATGFEFDFMSGLTVEDCSSIGNTAISLDPDTYASTTGMVIFGSTSLSLPVSGVSVSGCHIAGNNINTLNGDVEGIFIGSNFSDIAIKDTVIQDNVGSGAFDIGIWVQAFNADLHNVVVDNCIIESEAIGIYSNGDNNSIYQNNTITDVDFGVLLQGSSCNSINNNYVTNAGVGFEDDTVPSTSLFSNNKVFGSITPYSVTYAFGPLPVVNGSLETGFPSGAEVLDNVFMDNPTCTSAPSNTAVKAKKQMNIKMEKACLSKQKRMKKIESLQMD